jgi:RNA polymerase subunit RPABC4/transcription elongation factor Spt4
MTNSNNGRSIALVIIIVVLALLAFRSVFFLLPFGVLPGLHRSVGEIGPSISGWFHGFGWIGRLALFTLPAGLLLVLIANVIGLLIYAIVRSETPIRRPQGPPEQGPGQPPATCPSCGKPVGPGYAFCPYCGKDLKKTCPSCGRPVEEGWKVCPVCGADLRPDAARQA